MDVEALLWAFGGTVLQGSLLLMGSCKTRHGGYGRVMDVSAFMNGNIMLDLFCCHLMKDKTLIRLPGKSSSLEIHTGWKRKVSGP